MSSQDGGSSLLWASHNGHVEVVDKLLQHGATVDLQTKVCVVPPRKNTVKQYFSRGNTIDLQENVNNFNMYCHVCIYSYTQSL